MLTEHAEGALPSLTFLPSEAMKGKAGKVRRDISVVNREENEMRKRTEPPDSSFQTYRHWEAIRGDPRLLPRRSWS